MAPLTPASTHSAIKTRNGWRGGNNDREIDLLGQSGEVGIRFDAQNARPLGIDRKNDPPKWIADEIPEQCPSDTVGFFCRPNDRNALRFKDGIEGMMLLIAENGAGSACA